MDAEERRSYRWAAGCYGLLAVAFAVLAGATSGVVPPMAWVGNGMALTVGGIAAYCAWVARRQD